MSATDRTLLAAAAGTHVSDPVVAKPVAVPVAMPAGAAGTPADDGGDAIIVLQIDDTDKLATAVTLRGRNTHTGDTYATTLDASRIHDIVPVGFPPALTTPNGFANFARKAFRNRPNVGAGGTRGGAEKARHGGAATGPTTGEEGGAGTEELTCVVHEHAAKLVVHLLLAFGEGLFRIDLAVLLDLPLAHRATAAEKHDIELVALRRGFQDDLASAQATFTSEMARMREEIVSLRLQMNERVLFGRTHSVPLAATHVRMRQAVDIRHISYTSCPHAAKSTPAAAAAAAAAKQPKWECVVDLPSAGCPRAPEDKRVVVYADLPKLASECLAPLQLLRMLRVVLLEGPDITDVAALAHLPQLEHVALKRVEVRDLEPMSTLPKLKTFALVDTRLLRGAAIDLSPLQKCSALTTVSVYNSCAVSDVAALASVASLRTIIYAPTQVLSGRDAFGKHPVTFLHQAQSSNYPPNMDDWGV